MSGWIVARGGYGTGGLDHQFNIFKDRAEAREEANRLANIEGENFAIFPTEPDSGEIIHPDRNG